MIPAIDLLGGRAVFLVGGRRETAEVVSKDPVALALEWQRRGARRIHVVDLDGAFGSGENRDVVKAILRAVTIPVQVGGGLRDEDDLRDVLSFGASRAIVGTRAIRDPHWLRSMAGRFPSRVILALDRDARGLLLEGWQRPAGADRRQLIDLANALPLDGVLFTNVAMEGRLQGVGPVADDLVLRCFRPRIAAGGVTDRGDVEAVRRAGYDHVVVGKALYAGTLDFEEVDEAIL